MVQCGYLKQIPRANELATQLPFFYTHRLQVRMTSLLHQQQPAGGAAGFLLPHLHSTLSIIPTKVKL